MAYIGSNIGPILAATLVGLMVGAIYAAVLRHAGQLRHPAWLLLAILAEFWLACILAGALIVAPVQVGRWVVAIGSAVVIWMGFVLPSLLVSYGFRRQSAGATIGDLLHWLAVMVTQAAVLEAVGLTHP